MMDTRMHNNDILARFTRMLAEAENGQPAQDGKKETELDRYYRYIEGELGQYFSLPGFTLGDSVKAGPNARLGGGAEPPPGGYRLSEYIRLYLSDLFLHPRSSGGWGIGDSRNASDLLDRIKEDPSLRGTGGTGGRVTVIMLSNPESYPAGLRDYVAMLSKKFLLGMIRIGFEDCGLLSYLVYSNEEIANAIVAASDEFNDIEDLKSAIPADWDFEKMHHMMHVILPQFVLKLLVAPATPTPNCDKALIAQNAAYLGEDLAFIQSYIIPVEKEFNVNLQEKGSDSPASYNDMARYAAAWNFSTQDIKDTASRDANGNPLTYNPPDDAEVPDNMLSGPDHKESLQPRYTTEANPDGTHQYDNVHGNTVREYPSQKFGHWFVVDVDNDLKHASHNHNILKYGYTVIEDEHGQPLKFWLNGGRNPDDNEYNGVHGWCWLWGHYNNYRKLDEGDRAYMLLNDHVVAPEVLDVKSDGSRDEDLNGNLYDASAFGIVICGPGGDGVPGLVKPHCFQGRNDMSGGSYRPGAREAIHYPPQLVPYGGRDIPGLIHYGNWSNSTKADTAAAINNSIFILSLIGKWDGSIAVSNGKDSSASQIEFYTDKLVELMQRWFPVDLGSATREEGDDTEKTIKLTTIGDLSTLGRFLSEGDDDKTVKQLVLSVFRTNDGTSWHLIHAEKSKDKGVVGYIFDPADDEFRLRAARSSDRMSEQEYDTAIGELPALVYTKGNNGRFIPFLTTKLTVSEARELLAKWNSPMGTRPLRERIGTGDVTPRPGSAGEEDGPDDSIQWASPMSSAGKHRNVGFAPDGSIWIRGPETENEPRTVTTDKLVADILRDKALRSTYIATDSGNYNLWITTGTGAADNKMYIVYLRRGRAKIYEMMGDILGDTTNALLRNAGILSLGNLLGDPARLNRQNSDRYTLFINMSDIDMGTHHGPVVDGAGIYANTLRHFADEFSGCIGLGVSNGRIDFTQGGDTVVGTMDWYNAVTLEFVRTTEITLNMVTRSGPKIPRINML